jgi:tetratricopeptide (TPR) repeat protein
MDSQNFVYTTTGRTESQQTQSGQIRRFSPGGIMTTDTSSINFADVSIGTIMGKTQSQDLLGIALDDENYIFALDSAYGRIFLYDKDYNLLSAFGAGLGRGEQLGTFALPCAIETNGQDVLVCDSTNNNVTVFKITDYGKLVKTARKMTMNGDYEESKALWQEVLALDKNSQLAYNGLAKALYVEGDYKQAMEYAKLGIDKETYGQAFKWVRRDYIKDNFVWLFLIAVAVLGSLCGVLIYLTKRKVTILSNPKVNVMFSSVAHPFDSFTKVKYNNLGSIPLSLILLTVFYITTVLKTTSSGYLYSNYNAAEFNSLYMVIRTFGLVILWTVCNWGVCALRGGIGKLKEIFIVTCYSLIPIIFGNIVYIILTNVMLPTEAGFLSVLMNALTIYAAFMLIIGIMKVHDYEFGKFIGTTIMSIVGMAIVLCLIILIIILVQQLGAFVLTIIMEVAYR